MTPSDTDIHDEELVAWRQQHVGRLLLQAYRAFNIRAVAKLRARGHTELGLPHVAALANLDVEGTHITTLAERAGMTKQAMGRLVADLERQGYLTRSVDPNDRRAAIVTYTACGRQFLRDAFLIKHEIEAEFAQILGPDGLNQLRTLLSALIAHEGEATQLDGSPK